MAAEQVLLLTIGAGPLPNTTPIVPVTTTGAVDSHTADAPPAPTGVSITDTLDGVILRWLPPPIGTSIIIQTAPDVSGSPGTWTDWEEHGIGTVMRRITLPQDPFWVRFITVVWGRRSSPTTPVLVASLTDLRAAFGAAVGGQRTRAGSSFFLAADGAVKLGGISVNYGSGFTSGATITYSASAGSPATATISVTAGSFAIGSKSYSYNASSVGVTGTNGTSVKYYLYYDDPGLAAGSKTLYASTDATVTYASDSKLFVGEVTVVYPSSGTGSGGGHGPCVSVDAWVIGRSGLLRAGDVRVGDDLLLCDPVSREECWGTVTYSQRKPAPGVRIEAALAALTCSTSAPIPSGSRFVLAPDTFGLPILVRDAGGRLAEVIVDTVADVGTIDVQHITVGDRCFWASDDGQHFVLHHNTKPPPENP